MFWTERSESIEKVCVPRLQMRILKGFRIVTRVVNELKAKPQVILHVRDLEGCYKVEFTGLTASQVNKIGDRLSQDEITHGQSFSTNKRKTATIWL